MVARSTVRSTIRPTLRTIGNSSPIGSGGGVWLLEGGTWNDEGVWLDSATWPLDPLLLDTYTGAAAAYALRKLRTAYTGACIRVRRSSDSAEQDIGFASNVLDTASLLTFCGAGDGFVTKRYDQSGNGNDQFQATALLQPKIVASGSVIETNGKPAIDWGLTGNLFLSFTTGISVRSAYLVLQTPDTTSTDKPFILGDTASFPYHAGASGVWLAALASANVRSGANRINGATVNLTTATRTTSQIVLSMVHTATVTASTVSRDRANSGRSWCGTRQEEIFWATDQSANTGAIEADIAAFYGITLA